MRMQEGEGGEQRAGPGWPEGLHWGRFAAWCASCRAMCHARTHPPTLLHCIRFNPSFLDPLSFICFKPSLLPSSAGDFIKYPSERRDAETLNMWVRTLTGTQ